MSRKVFAEGPNVSALGPGPDWGLTLENHRHNIHTGHIASKKHRPTSRGPKSEVNTSRHRDEAGAGAKAGT